LLRAVLRGNTMEKQKSEVNVWQKLVMRNAVKEQLTELLMERGAYGKVESDLVESN